MRDNGNKDENAFEVRVPSQITFARNVLYSTALMRGYISSAEILINIVAHNKDTVILDSSL